ncbi:hypothetical protein CC86DRAFT_341515 [Ophiobolus disseminans]|uniref:U6 snRNA phosphodiesterase n=1 Tax=Ophiobolus disseminans TaxID=1469910 RepID=A0A6A7ACW1_9PLEO|nr:hypothetical protein CC86DRAFT_341515 [Ophiobolus disseminans]
MSLVQYPDSDTDEEDKGNAIPARPSQNLQRGAVKRKHTEPAQDELPPLPAAFHDLYSTNARVSTSDNPSLHGGRKRAIPHVDGNWPSHVYLEWNPSQAESDNLHKLIHHVKDLIERSTKTRAKHVAVPKIIPSLQSELGAPLPLHISLSRTLHIQTDDRDDFLETLKTSLRRAAVSSFYSQFSNLKWVPNFERNRWFLVLGIKQPAQDELNRLLRGCNDATTKCGHSGLYIGGQGDGPMEDNPQNNNAKRRKSQHFDEEAIDRSDRFHISIAWNLEEPDPDIISEVQGIDVSKFVQPPEAAIAVVKARIGNVVHNVDLKKASR